MKALDHIVPRLQSQISRGEPVLFLGAGFSIEAIDSSGDRLPTSRELTEEFWKIAFPSEPCERSVRLGDAYYAAEQHSSTSLLTYIRNRLSCNAETLPEFYRTWFSLPWVRCYTLNVDDLEQAALRRFHFERDLVSISATSGKIQGKEGGNPLEVVHLNGAIWDDLRDMTFSELDYGVRLSTPDKWWMNCVTDITSRPAVFVGTELNESLLWQYVQYRQRRGARGTRELRPGSYLVCPELNAARQRLLRELNVDWIPMTAREFEAEVLSRLPPQAARGHQALQAKHQAQARSALPRLVSDIAAENPSAKTEYLLGQEPTWADLHSGRAIERLCDSQVYEIAIKVLNGKAAPGPLVMTGTAGSGKSTSLMRLGLRLSGEGIPTYWVDEESNFKPFRLREVVVQGEGPVGILVDDADLWGTMVSGWAKELPFVRPGVLFAAAIRSSKVDGVLDKDTLGGIDVHEISMPHLADEDIESLIDVLNRENRLGILRGQSHQKRIEAFRDQAGRQLLVAMIQATSGKLLREKVIEEFSDLSERQKMMYAILCLVSSQRFRMDREEVLLASGTMDNEALYALDALAQRNLIFRKNLHSEYAARHRVIADEVVNAMQFREYLEPVLEGVCFAFANRISATTPWNDRRWRRLIRFINHDFILNLTTPEVGRHVYAQIEQALNWDYHYWLQRGSLEVEQGDLELATNFLDQARSLAPGERTVETEYAYLLMKKAARNPSHTDAKKWFSEGKELLQDLIEQHGNRDPYPYHVIGSQGLAWARQGSITNLEKRTLLRELLDVVNSGVGKHRRAKDLTTLSRDLTKEWLLTAVVRSN